MVHVFLLVLLLANWCRQQSLVLCLPDAAVEITVQVVVC